MDNNSNEIEILFREATLLRDRDELNGARDLLEKALSLNPPRRAPLLGTLAHVYFLKGDLEKARVCYEEATQLSPKSELGSLGYFHTLWNLELYDEAYQEAKRFLSLSESNEYLLMIEEMRDAFKAAGIDISERGV